MPLDVIFASLDVFVFAGVYIIIVLHMSMKHEGCLILHGANVVHPAGLEMREPCIAGWTTGRFSTPFLSVGKTSILI